MKSADYNLTPDWFRAAVWWRRSGAIACSRGTFMGRDLFGIGYVGAPRTRDFVRVNDGLPDERRDTRRWVVAR